MVQITLFLTKIKEGKKEDSHFLIFLKENEEKFQCGVGSLTAPPPSLLKYFQIGTSRHRLNTLKVWFSPPYIYMFINSTPMDLSCTVCEEFSESIWKMILQSSLRQMPDLSTKTRSSTAQSFLTLLAFSRAFNCQIAADFQRL